MERADQRARPLRLASLVGALALAAACAEPCPAPVEAAPAAIPAGSYETPLVMALPFRAADLDADLYTLTRGHSGYACGPTDSPASRRCALDIRALRWDPESDNYTRSASAAHVSSPALVDDVMWGLAVASPIDGEIIACWRNMPDDDVDGDDHNCPGGAEICTAAGNHLVIRTPSRDQVVILAHLQARSVPAALCPIDDVYLYTSDPKVCARGSGWRGWRNTARLDLRGIAPIPVRRGEVVGRVGASGSGVGVHLHVHASAYAEDVDDNPCEGDFAPVALRDASYQPRIVGAEPRADAWQPLVDATLPIDGDELLLLPEGEARGCVPTP